MDATPPATIEVVRLVVTLAARFTEANCSATSGSPEQGYPQRIAIVCAYASDVEAARSMFGAARLRQA
eukprot:8984702-Lingulodinium_polyedra.AAC.1